MRNTIRKTVPCLNFHNTHHPKPSPIPSRPFRPTPDLYATHLEICARDRSLDSGRKTHSQIIVNGLSQSIHLSLKLLTFYVHCDQLSDALHIFDETPKPNIGGWTVLITAFSRRGLHEESFKLFCKMRREGLRPNKYIIPSILKACAKSSDVRTGEILHGFFMRSSSSDTFIDSALILMYSKCGRIAKARTLFDRAADKDLVAWNSMISGYVRLGLARDALDLFEEMRAVGVKPDVVTWNALIAGFAQMGEFDVALDLFDSMRVDRVSPDVVSWTSIVSGYVQNFCYDQAFEAFERMLVSGVCPSSVTVSTILPACVDSKRGKEIHGYAVVIGVEEELFVCSSLIDMYAKCGFMSKAEKLFNKMTGRNTVAWNSMIFGYANQGYCDEAIELYHRMVKEEFKPDHLTFTAVISACSLSGMVELGWSLFESMRGEHGIEPRLEHYACMVDLLGRAGRVYEAYDLIQGMPMKPDSFVWGALLGACRNHHCLELAQIAASHLFKMKPESAGSSVLLSNLYADFGRWEDAIRLKKKAKKRRMMSSQGRSWIGI
ncbi:Pentatricopeptide repeat-containing protein [Acorus gramineus]|uniref:Pentatricopeptide repeat-containing protein n=1 Tax=Acorus gramineus TaxID=55184 RepID=A0AAV9B466_ACOGR|nr:Pentatricopeptide repeat-containing protein [Acorus gramineus]